MRILADFAARPWAMERTHLDRFFADLGAVDLEVLAARASAALAARDTAPTEPAAPFDLVGTDAVIGVRGMLLTSVPEWMAYYGIAATSYDAIAAAVAAADADPRVSRIVLAFDTPGGMAGGGVQSAADAIFAAVKPTIATCQDLCASAGIYLASQADRFVAAQGATVGSIGTYMVTYDASRMADREGVTVHVVASGPEKGGAFGAPVSREKLAGYQKTVNDLTDLFVAAVARGRGMTTDETRQLATGAVWLAAQAAEVGLIDAVQTHAQVLAGGSTAPTPRVAIRHAPTAGTTPATTESTMDPKKLAALCSAHPNHTGLILAMNADGKTESEIASAIAGAVAAADKVAIGELRAKVTAHEATIAARDQTIATLTKERDDLKALGGGAAKDPGEGEAEQAKALTAEQCRAGVDPKAILAGKVKVG